VAKVRKGGAWWYYAWGLNKHGQLGVRSYEESPYPQEVRKLRGKNVVEVAAGTNFTIVLTEEGEMWGCGQNDDGQLGLGEDYVYEDSEAEEELGKDLEDKMSLLEKEKVEEKAVE
jgi:alpha-tubulin suppressor-like RCC1 family protein